ncbi:hypothetical protein JX266_013875 [Neoarthrinium moseri]|nr:hypothetical protein JX266_013875 [Neoarthrinium moseri]
MHTREQKVKARRSGKSLLGKAKILGKKANVFSMATCWDPIHKKMRTVVHLPPGQKMPSLETFTLEVQAEQPDDLWCYRDGRSGTVRQKKELRQGNQQIKQSCVVPRPGGVKKSSGRDGRNPSKLKLETWYLDTLKARHWHVAALYRLTDVVS